MCGPSDERPEMNFGFGTYGSGQLKPELVGQAPEKGAVKNAQAKQLMTANSLMVRVVRMSPDH